MDLGGWPVLGGLRSRALLDAAVGDAGAADPLSVEGLVDAYDSVAEGAGRPGDPGDAGLV